MDFTKRFKAAINTFRTVNNTMGSNISRDFLKYGNQKPLIQDWSKVVMTDKDLYKGYPYAAINNRANGVARLAKNYLHTNAEELIQKKAKENREEVVHPYIERIDESKTFANNKFWYDISTYIDLEGVYYLFAKRTVEGDRVGNILEFKLLNPYNIRRIINKETFEVGGYVETREGMVRQFAKQQIIEIRKLNPFSEDDPFATIDAAKENQYTLNQAGDYTRHSLKNNMAAPGIISTDVLLDTQQFQNFVSRVTNQEKGLPLFGNGAGAITWDSMQIDMDKAALDKIHEIHRQALFAVSGAGKTVMSIEESGTTRDTARAQKEIFTENHVLPQAELIIDALNQDFKVYYESEYKKTKYELVVENPLGSDKETELKEIKLRDESLKLYDKLVGMGYKRDIAARYANGEMTLEELGEPSEEARPDPKTELLKLKMLGDGTPKEEEKPKKKPTKKAKEDDKKQMIDVAVLSTIIQLLNDNKLDNKKEEKETKVQKVENELDEDKQGLINTQQASLQNTIQNIEAGLTNEVLNNLFSEVQNAFEDDTSILSDTKQKEYANELEAVLATFFGVLIPIYATSTLSKRLKEFNRTASFKLDQDVKKYIKSISNKTSNSHIDTIVEDLRGTIKETYDEEVKTQAAKIASGRSPTDKDLVLARKKALEGASRQRIINSVKTEYNNKISTTRAKAIARTETNRAFTRAQYEADKQFVSQNKLTGQAYKKWNTRSDNPCPICIHLASLPPIPFEKNFLDLGEELTVSYTDDKGKAKVLKHVVNFEDLEAGNAHVNCSCNYLLVIRD